MQVRSRRRAIVAGARSGDWLDATRIVGYPAVVLALSIGALALAVASGSDMRDGLSGQPLGSDFLSFWSASRLALEGTPELAYDVDILHGVQQSVMGTDSPFYAWLYPPIAFLVVYPLGALGYLPALVLWLALTFTGYATGVWRFLPDRRAILPIVAFPPVLLTVMHGQNALLSAALLGWGLWLLPRNPWLAGALMGAMVYKPHLALLVPLALISARSWRALMGAASSAAGLCILTYLLWGQSVWQGFLGSSELARRVLEQGLVDWEKMISTFAAVRMLGAPVPLAWVLQGVVTTAAAVVVWRAWRSDSHHLVKVAVLPAAALLATPFALDYDAMLLAITIVGLASLGLAGGFRTWEITGLALLWLAPLLWRPLSFLVPLPWAVTSLLLALVLGARRAGLVPPPRRRAEGAPAPLP